MKTKIKFSAVLVLALTTAADQAQTFTTIKSFGDITNVTGFKPVSTLVMGSDGTLYGTTLHGGGSVAGTVFKMQPDGSGFAVLKWFTNSAEGANPYPGLVLSGATLYGTTANGGASDFGTVFKVNTDGTGYAVLKSFSGGNDGAHPYFAALTLSGSALYGATYDGGSSNSGTLFTLNTDGTGFTTLHRFAALNQGYYTNSYGDGVLYYTNSDGANPDMALTVSGSVLYGTTENGGSASYGTVFAMNTNGTGYTVLHTFTNNPDGAYPDGVLTLSGGVLYGTTYRGGSYVMGYYNAGTVFRVNTDGTGYAILKTFTYTDGENPSGSLALSGSVLYGTTPLGGSLGNGTVFKLNTDGTGYTVLKDFAAAPDGFSPYAGLTLSGGVLYGTTYGGGSSLGGTVFKLNADGTGFTVLKNFVNRFAVGPDAPLTLSGGVLYGTTAGTNPGSYGSSSGTVFKVNTDGTGYAVLKGFTGGSDGQEPEAGLVLSGTALYGTTADGGNSNSGTVFMVNTDGTGYTILKHLTGGSDGREPYAGLVLSGSVLYGTTWGGGSSNSGTLFQLNTDGTGFTVLKDFKGGSDGAAPLALTLSGSVLYGTTAYGGSSNYGTVFELNTDGTGYTVLKHFAGGDGANPEADLLTLSDGVLYGTTWGGGSSNSGTVFMLNADGTGFTVLKSFTGGDGAQPLGGLVLVGSVLYGTSENGGSAGYGTVFTMNTDGTGYTVLKSFTGGGDGAYPYASLTLSGTVLYGTTSDGGAWGDGSVFSLSFAPQLSIALAGVPPSGIILTWPTNFAGFDYTGYTLQSTTNLGSLAAWATNSTAPMVVNGLNTVTNPLSGPQQFYRLFHQ